MELSLELAGTALNVATGHYYDLYGDQYASTVGFTHTGFLKQGGNLVMKIYDVRRSPGGGGLCLLSMGCRVWMCKRWLCRSEGSGGQGGSARTLQLC